MKYEILLIYPKEKVIGFKYKIDSLVERYKDTLGARGYTQTCEIDF